MSVVFTIPIFPLQIVVFPFETLNLHIFEPRYKQLIQDCFSEGTLFGIPTVMDGKIMPIGTSVKIISIDRTYPGGEMDIRTEGVRVFEMEQCYKKGKDKLYGTALIKDFPFEMDVQSGIISSKIAVLLQELYELTKIKKKHAGDLSLLHTYQYAHYAGLSLAQEYQLLTISAESERQVFMLNHLEAFIPAVREIENLRHRSHMNGHFKKIDPI